MLDPIPVVFNSLLLQLPTDVGCLQQHVSLETGQPGS